MKKASGQNNCYSKYVFFERSQNYNNFLEKRLALTKKLLSGTHLNIWKLVFRFRCAHHIFCGQPRFTTSILQKSL